MTKKEKPYFMTNDAWWYVDDDWRVQIRDNAPEEAKKSYYEWLKDHE